MAKDHSFSVIFVQKIRSLCVFGFVFILFLLLIPNWLMISTTRRLVFTDYKQMKNSAVGIILGASVYPGRRVSPVVSDRIDSAVMLYKKGKVRKLLISGDHSQKYYDEVNTIKFWLLKNEIPPRDIYMDHSGFSTHESINRARKIFKIKNVIIITQAFHLPRALYLAKRQGISAQGYVADQRMYKNSLWFNLREYLARVKDFIISI